MLLMDLINIWNMEENKINWQKYENSISDISYFNTLNSHELKAVKKICSSEISKYKIEAFRLYDKSKLPEIKGSEIESEKSFKKALNSIINDKDFIDSLAPEYFKAQSFLIQINERMKELDIKVLNLDKPKRELKPKKEYKSIIRARAFCILLLMDAGIENKHPAKTELKQIVSHYFPDQTGQSEYKMICIDGLKLTDKDKYPKDYEYGLRLFNEKK
jgi:hypothetical protein